MNIKKRFLVLIMVALVPASMLCAGQAQQAQDDVRTIAKGSNEFACKLFSQLSQKKGNSFFSPYSISSALAMTYAGARGRTAEQMAGVLGFSLPQEKLFPAMSELMDRLNASGKDYKLYIANALWAQKGYPFAPAFQQTVGKYFGAGFREVDYTLEKTREQARLMINAWTEEKTANRIKELIKPSVLDELTRLVLTNAIYFKGTWASPFKTSGTRNMPFALSGTEKADVPMMNQTGQFGYTEDGNVQVLEMRYAGGDLSMVVLLPTAASSVEKLAEVLPQKLDHWLARISGETVYVSLPKFQVEQEFLLNDQLIALGMPDAFSATLADFSGMQADGKSALYISDVIHKAFVEVNEEGTEAAAATAVVMGLKSISLPAEFKADHPFLFLIRDVRTKTILFMGRVSDPR